MSKAEDYAAKLGVSPNFWKLKPLKDFNQKEWEAVCSGCGRCCLCRVKKRKKFYPTTVACSHLNLRTGRCEIYADRFKNNQCEKVDLEDLRKQSDSYFFSCAYYLLYKGYDLPDWHPLKTGDPNSTYSSGNSVCNYSLHSEKDIKEEDLYDYIVDWEDLDSYIQVNGDLYCKATKLG